MTVPTSTSYDHLPIVEERFAEKPEPYQPTLRQHKSPRPYAEMRASSAFSFLDAASLPEDLIGTAAECGVGAMALIDRNGVYGAPRFYTAAKKAGVRALVGAELVLENGKRASLLVGNRTGYKNLCKLITAGAIGKPKGEPVYSWDLIGEYAEGLHCLTRDDPEVIDRIAGTFQGRTHVELQRHRIREEEHRNQLLIAYARRKRLPLIATNGVRYARPENKELHDVLTCIREGQHVDKAGQLLGINRERHI
ncbi:MAG TPA: PHP domain-containing protein, partial [Thermoanaerobaculia bacterium]|nr:PHP domain-containing protein [Thermoanaerobaculia bacterium]